MKIAINATSAVYGGGVTYLNKILEELTKIDKKNEYLVLTAGRENHQFNKINCKNWRCIKNSCLQFLLFRIFWEHFFCRDCLKKII